MPVPMIIDSDIALDDWMAILYLLQSPEADVKAITVCGTGEAHAKPGMRTALRLLNLADHPLIPVAAGSPRPMKGKHVFPYIVRLTVDLHLFETMPVTRESALTVDAPSLIIKMLEETNEPLSIVALGPLTNLGDVFLRRPDLAGKVAAITLMGGAFDVPGNIMAVNPRIKNQHAEWNIFIDPHAANIVFSSGVPVYIVPLDATNKVPMSREFLAKLSQDKEIPAVEFLYRALKHIAGMSKGERIFYFWDPLAAVLALHPEIGKSESSPVKVVEGEGQDSGRTMRCENGHSVKIFTDAVQVNFEKIYLEGLRGKLFPG